MISRLAVTSWVICQSLTMATLGSPNSGRWVEIGSCRAMSPRSNNCITATAATTFDIDARRKIESVCMGTSSSALPNALK